MAVLFMQPAVDIDMFITASFIGTGVAALLGAGSSSPRRRVIVGVASELILLNVVDWTFAALCAAGYGWPSLCELAQWMKPAVAILSCISVVALAYERAKIANEKVSAPRRTPSPANDDVSEVGEDGAED